MSEEQKEKITAADEFIKTLGDIDSTIEVENMIQNNQIEFNINDKKYRVRKPTLEEQKQLETFRRKKYVELINDDSMMFQKQWIKKYKEKGIDIEAMEKEIRDLQSQIDQTMIKLAKTAEDGRVAQLEEEIIGLKRKQAMLHIEKTDLLNYSIEDQLLIAVNSFYTYIVLEIEIDGKWQKVYNNFDEFDNSKDTKLIYKAFHYMSHLIYNLGI